MIGRCFPRCMVDSSVLILLIDHRAAPLVPLGQTPLHSPCYVRLRLATLLTCHGRGNHRAYHDAIVDLSPTA